MKHISNPINIEYKYQFIHEKGKARVSREAADPSLIMFKGKYYMFPSMTVGFLVSEDLVEWEYHSLKDVPVYDYAPDVRAIGEYLYFSASKRDDNCSFFRTKDPINGEFEEIEGTFPFWDPNLFCDDDGKIYFYWGMSNDRPIYGVELEPKHMKPIGNQVELIFSDTTTKGYERTGENHIAPRTPEHIEENVKKVIEEHGGDVSEIPEEQMNMLRQIFGNDPFIEGPWMDKHNGKYYLQYASPGTEYNVYSDAVYVSDHPLGPFTLAKNNPYSYKPGGFITGAGHGSTMQDKSGNLWHTSTMSISVNHRFERRLGLWPAGIDQDGELFCNQRYGDWPMKVEQGKINPWKKPEWMLLSYSKPAQASSFETGKEASKATDENIRTWWKAENKNADEWLEVDLKHECDVRAIQINFADDEMYLSLPKGAEFQRESQRYIDTRRHYTRWLLEGSLDGKEYFIIKDKSNTTSNLPHDLVVKDEGIRARFIRCTVKQLPYDQKACISGLRVFGIGEGELPERTKGIQTRLVSDLDLSIKWEQDNAVGHNVLWGFAPDKLYHSYMVMGSNNVNIGALVKGQRVYMRIDSFNEVGITEGEVFNVVE